LFPAVHELALALLEHDATYEEFVLKFVGRFFWIAAAVDPVGEHPDEMWDEEDGFFYDVLRAPRRRTHARRQHGSRSTRRHRTTAIFLISLHIHHAKPGLRRCPKD
jgi:hypothetical protein